MTLSAILFLAATGSAPSADVQLMATQIQVAQVQVAQVQIEQTTIVRIRPAMATAPAVSIPPMRWQEKKGPNCIQVNAIGGALVSAPDSIDIVLRGGSRLRAKLEKSCTAIDFYQGFYVKPSRDGRICEDRDTIRSRMGAECEIDKFKTLVPAKER